VRIPHHAVLDVVIVVHDEDEDPPKDLRALYIYTVASKYVSIILIRIKLMYRNKIQNATFSYGKNWRIGNY